MIERHTDLIIVRDSEEDLREVLSDLGLPPSIKVEKSSEFDAKLRQLRTELEQLQQHDLNQADAEVKARLGRFHFPLKKTLYFAFTTTVKLSGAALAAVANPLAGGIAITGVLLDVGAKANELFSRFSPEQLVVFEALGAAILKKRADDPKAKAATLTEVEAVFEERDEAGPNLSDVLNALADTRKGVERHKIGGEERYAIIA